MCPQPMIASRNTEAGHVVVDNGEKSRLPIQRSPYGSDQTEHGYADNEGDIQPVDVLVPVRSCQLGVCNVRFLWVIALISVGL